MARAPSRKRVIRLRITGMYIENPNHDVWQDQQMHTMPAIPSSPSAAPATLLADSTFLMRRFVAEIAKVGAEDLWAQILASLPVETQHAVVHAGALAIQGQPNGQDAVVGLEVIEGKLESMLDGGAGGGALFGGNADDDDEDFEVTKTRRMGESTPDAAATDRDGDGREKHGPETRPADGSDPPSGHVEGREKEERVRGSSPVEPPSDDDEVMGEVMGEPAQRGDSPVGGPSGHNHGDSEGGHEEDTARRASPSGSEANNIGSAPVVGDDGKDGLEGDQDEGGAFNEQGSGGEVTGRSRASSNAGSAHSSSIWDMSAQSKGQTSGKDGSVGASDDTDDDMARNSELEGSPPALGAPARGVRRPEEDQDSEVDEDEDSEGSGPPEDAMEEDQEEEDEHMGSPAKRPRLDRDRRGRSPHASSAGGAIRDLFEGNDDWGGKVDVPGKNRRAPAGVAGQGRGGTGGDRPPGPAGESAEDWDEDAAWAEAERLADRADEQGARSREREGGNPVRSAANSSAVPTGMMKGLVIGTGGGADGGSRAGPSQGSTTGRDRIRELLGGAGGGGSGGSQGGVSSQSSTTGRDGRNTAAKSGARRKASKSPDASYRPSGKSPAARKVTDLLAPMGGKVVVPPNAGSGRRIDIEESSLSPLESEKEDTPPPPSGDPMGKGKGTAPNPTTSSDSDREGTSAAPATSAKGKGKARATTDSPGDVGEDPEGPAPAPKDAAGKDPLGGTWTSWAEACKMVLEICRPGATDPVVAVTTALQLALCSRGGAQEMEPTALMRDSEHDEVLLSMRNFERTYELNTSGALPVLVDLCAFVLSRRAEIMREAKEKRRGQQVATRPNRSDMVFRASNALSEGLFTKKDKTGALRFDDSKLSTTGARVLGITSMLGSLAFLPVLLASEEFQNWRSVRDAPAPRYYAFGVLLRGGRPKLELLQPSQRQLVEAAFFAAKEILPRILQAYLCAVFMLHDDAVSKGKKDLRDVLFAAPLDAAAAELGRNPADTVAPQSPLIRMEPGGRRKEKAPLLLGVISGYGYMKKPIVNPPYAMLSRNFHKISDEGLHVTLEGLVINVPNPATEAAFAQSLDPACPLAVNTPVCQTKSGGPDMLQYVTSYCAQMDLDRDSPAVLNLIAAISSGKDFVGPRPELYTEARLQQLEEERASEIARTAGGRFQPVSDDEEADTATQGTSRAAGDASVGGRGSRAVGSSSQTGARLALPQQPYRQEGQRRSGRR
ncbi:hypothetical protein CF319_g7886 [Tilletia indica]|nr:hypothetical protein CF319_g7886 [Tilletia indica]